MAQVNSSMMMACLIGLVATQLSFALPARGNILSKRQSGKVLCQGKAPIKIDLLNPGGGWTVSRMLEVSGSISDKSCDPITVNINGDRYLLRTIDGQFKRKFPIAAGKNSVIVSATGQSGTVSESRTVYGKVPPVAMTAILTSDTDGVYTDLHIYEPDPSLTNAQANSTPPQKHVYWADTESPSGGKFYLNEQGGSFDQPGYGPYLYTHTSPPIGIYRIDANYWPSGDKAHTLGTLNLVLFGGTASEVRKVIRQPLVAPGETVTLAWIKIGKNQTASVYIPGSEPKPRNTNVWPQFVIDAPDRVKSDSSNGNADY
ncbi:MAG: hypothetical protein JNJ49_07145 [Bdellovibrionaceae bacterium]|nr:hypothetical protein [Pseudobdellovibrionaceae bacterium]